MNVYNDTIGHADNSNITGRFHRSWKEIHGRELRSWEFDEAPKADRAVLVAMIAIALTLLIASVGFGIKLGG